jgi:hypothetical protein
LGCHNARGTPKRPAPEVRANQPSGSKGYPDLLLDLRGLPDGLATELDSFLHSLEAEDLAPATRLAYE